MAAQAYSRAKSSSPAQSDACALLSKQSAAAALAEAVTGPTASSGRSIAPGTTASSCEYTGSGLHKVNLNLWRASPDGAAQFKAIYGNVCGTKTKDGLSGFGDMACWYNEKHEELQVLKGTTFFSIELRRSGDPTESIKSVAKSVLDQLR